MLHTEQRTRSGEEQAKAHVQLRHIGKRKCLNQLMLGDCNETNLIHFRGY
jgi:hypothetical protein